MSDAKARQACCLQVIEEVIESPRAPHEACHSEAPHPRVSGLQVRYNSQHTFIHGSPFEPETYQSSGLQYSSGL